MFQLAVIYENGKRYIADFAILEEVIPMTDEQKEELKNKILLEIQK